MKIDPHEVGARLRAAREAAGLSQEEFAAKISQKSAKKGITPINPETVRLWEKGSHPPQWNKLAQICSLLRIEEDELLFGSRRLEQIRSERPRLVYVTPKEADLIIIFRHSSGPAQLRILEVANTLADNDPG